MDPFQALMQATGFDWDTGNLSKNWIKHRVRPVEVEQVFFNRPLVAAADPAHSLREARFYVLGRSNEDRLLFVVFTLRNNLIRVISARDMSRKERKVYGAHEQEESDSSVQE